MDRFLGRKRFRANPKCSVQHEPLQNHVTVTVIKPCCRVNYNNDVLVYSTVHCWLPEIHPKPHLVKGYARDVENGDDELIRPT